MGSVLEQITLSVTGALRKVVHTFVCGRKTSLLFKLLALGLCTELDWIERTFLLKQTFPRGHVAEALIGSHSTRVKATGKWSPITYVSVYSHSIEVIGSNLTNSNKSSSQELSLQSSLILKCSLQTFFQEFCFRMCTCIHRHSHFGITDFQGRHFI